MQFLKHKVYNTAACIAHVHSHASLTFTLFRLSTSVRTGVHTAAGIRASAGGLEIILVLVFQQKAMDNAEGRHGILMNTKLS